ncbi:hypothetical protein OAJ57_03275 [Alphaproteobacteria bacterium]|nr:hypothetical protein [Alphaproteobacteria bacterium]
MEGSPVRASEQELISTSLRQLRQPTDFRVNSQNRLPPSPVISPLRETPAVPSKAIDLGVLPPTAQAIGKVRIKEALQVFDIDRSSEIAAQFRPVSIGEDGTRRQHYLQ